MVVVHEQKLPNLQVAGSSPASPSNITSLVARISPPSGGLLRVLDVCHYDTNNPTSRQEVG
jgi:hypothetical protein